MDNKLQTQGYTTFLNRTEKRLYGTHQQMPQVQELQQTIAKTAKTDYLDKKLNNFERKLEEFALEERKREAGLADGCKKLKNNIAEKTEAFKVKVDKKANEFVGFYESKVDIIQNEVKERKTVENNVLNRLDDRYIALRHEIQNIAGDRQSDLESLYKALEIDLPRLNDQLVAEGRHTENLIEDLQERFQNEIRAIRNGLEDEIKDNDEHDQAIYNMLDDINEKTKSQLHDEKTQRRKCEENIFGLLEEACRKVNAIN